MPKRPTEEEKARRLMCSRCRKFPWTSYFGEKLCNECKRPPTTLQEPARPPARHWLDEKDETS